MLPPVRDRRGTPTRPELALPDKPSVAVLPFLNLSDDPEQVGLRDLLVFAALMRADEAQHRLEIGPRLLEALPGE